MQETDHWHAGVSPGLIAQRQEQQQPRATLGFGLVALIFIYTTTVTIVGDIKGLQIAFFFIGGIVVVSLISRAARSTELRVTDVRFDPVAEELIAEAAGHGAIRIIANHPDDRTQREYLLKEREEREASHIPPGDAVLFLEVTIRDASEFDPSLDVRGYRIGPYRILRTEGAAVPNAIAAVLLDIRDRTDQQPHIYFGWVEGNPLKYLARFILFGEGDVAPVTHEILRRAEPNPRRRPAIHVG